MIRAVLFDLDGTLRFSRPDGVDAFFQFSSELGLSFCADARRKVERWTHAFWSGKHNGVAGASGDLATFWLDYTRRQLLVAGVQEDAPACAQALCEAFNTRYHPQSYIHPQAYTVLRAIKESNYTLGLVSNRAEELTPLATQLGLGDYFHFTLSGGQANSWKPDARIFWQACEMAHAEPGECLYVGDNFYADVVGAQNAGLVPVLLDPGDVFPDAECVRVKCLGDLLSVISQSVTWQSPLPLHAEGIIMKHQGGSMNGLTNYQQALLDKVKELPEESLPNLLQIVHLFKESLLSQSHKAALALQAEFIEWDKLSDEALTDFEKGLA